MPLLAFVTLGPGGGPVDARSLSSSWARFWPREPRLEDLEAKDGVMVFPFMGELATVSHMPGPLPWSDLEGPAAMAWHWEKAEEVLKAHETHLLVGLLGSEGEPIARAIQLTLLTAAAIDASAVATGVYWPEGTTVTPAGRFLASARVMEPEQLPLLSWVEFRVFPGDQPGRWSLFTTGLRALGHMEIEIRDSSAAPPDLIDRVYDIAHYLTQAGPVLNDGDTLGGSADERLQVRHLPSAWEREGPVLSIDL